MTFIVFDVQPLVAADNAAGAAAEPLAATEQRPADAVMPEDAAGERPAGAVIPTAPLADLESVILAKEHRLASVAQSQPSV